MKKISLVKFGLCLIILVALSCGKPRLDSLNPNSGPPHSLVEIQGDAALSRILWDATATTPDTLQGFWFGGGPFSVPAGATLGNHDVALVRSNLRSDATLPFTVTASTVAFPNPSITHISSIFTEAISGSPGLIRFFLFAQGPNIDVGSKMVVNGTEYDTFLWRALRYNSAGYNVATLKYPIFHYSKVFAIVEATIGSTLNISIKNLDNNLSNSLTFTVPTEANWDSDGDGLLDTWEENGYDPDGDGVIDCDLPAMGASKFIYDLFVEVDFMDGQNTTSPDKIPNVGAWPIIQQTFENSPLINFQEGLQGIQIHVDRGQSTFTDLNDTVHTIPASERKGGQILSFFDYIRMDGSATPFAATGETTENFYDFKTSNFDNTARREIFHYCVFANKHGHSNGSSGRGEIFGNDFFITLRDLRLSSATSSAGTFLHELGHNMNLRHGGAVNTSRKPNHLSVMSYYSSDGTFTNSYQIGGTDNTCDRIPDGVYDYSHGMLNDLDETSLNENNGMCNNVAIDWNGNGSIQNPVNFNIDGSSATVLTDHNNWGKEFIFNFRTSTDYAD